MKLVTGVVLACCVGGCGSPKADLAPIAEESETIKKDETDLVAKRGTLLRERKQIIDERASLAEKRKAVNPSDKAQVAALDNEEQQLSKKETDLVGQESELSKKLDQVLAQRAELIQKATAQVSVPGSTPEERAAKREQGVAQREKDVAKREEAVAEREQTLAQREQAQAKREKETCGTAVAMVAPAPKIELPKALKYSQHDVEPVYKKALKVMQEHGLLSADLSPTGGRLLDDTRSAMQGGDYVRAKYDADALLQEVEAMHVDRSFINAKMARLSGAMKGKSLDGDAKKQVDGLFGEVTTAYGDGKFSVANQKINRIYSLLR
jgi:hypothetical protein